PLTLGDHGGNGGAGNAGRSGELAASCCSALPQRVDDQESVLFATIAERRTADPFGSGVPFASCGQVSILLRARPELLVPGAVPPCQPAPSCLSGREPR